MMPFNSLPRYLVVFSFLLDFWIFLAWRHVSDLLVLSFYCRYFSQHDTCPWFVQTFPYTHVPCFFFLLHSGFHYVDLSNYFDSTFSPIRPLNSVFHKFVFFFFTGVRSVFLSILWHPLLQFLSSPLLDVSPLLLLMTPSFRWRKFVNGCKSFPR